jgi:BirA family transcriptional regulator, biotin operon repressor / biotin---[acetyl-CoA-carboxylase] ligase
MSTEATDHHVDRLIYVLVKNATVVVPGPKLASEAGVTRSTVWRWIERLRALGVDIKGHERRGYQLAQLPDILAPSLVRQHVPPHQAMGRKVIHYFRARSTNDLALSLDQREAPHGTVILAEEQTAGRGRMGRRWHSEKGSGIYSSVILRPPFAPSAAPILTLMAGLAARGAVLAATGLRADIRWPNDLLIGGKKVSGILTEMNAELDRLHKVVLGIGINVNHQRMPEDLKDIASSLAIEGGQRYSRLEVLGALLRELERYYRMLLEGGNRVIAAQWSAVSSYAKGRRLRIRRGNDEFTAITAGLDQSGALQVRREDGREELLVAGEVEEVK